jgi:hypothetical protein
MVKEIQGPLVSHNVSDVRPSDVESREDGETGDVGSDGLLRLADAKFKWRIAYSLTSNAAAEDNLN